MKKTNVRILINIIIAALTLFAWGLMMFRSDGALTATGIEGMKFFTAQSNIFRGIVSAAAAVLLRKGMTEKGKKRLAFWSYLSTCCVGVTFIVVFVFFGPLYGLPFMLRNANFFFHLVIPVLSLVEFVAFNDVRIRMPKLLFAALPPLIYGLGYLTNLLVNGVGYGPDSNDWYGFAIWGIPIGLGIFAVICAVSVLTGVVIAGINARVIKRKNR